MLKSASKPRFTSIKNGFKDPRIQKTFLWIITSLVLAFLLTPVQQPIARTYLLGMLGLTFLIGLFFYSIYHFSFKNISKFNSSAKDLLFLSSVLISVVLLIKFSVFISVTFEDRLSYLTPTVVEYAVPVAAGAMLVRFILNSETAIIFSAIMALFSGLFLDNSLMFALYFLIGSLIGAHGLRYCIQRSTLLKAGIKVGLANIIFILCHNMINSSIIQPETLFGGVFGFLNGIIAAIIVTGLAPLVEAIFGYTSNIKLLELTHLDHPVLRELILRAPGSYHHSIIVGNLAEAAAEAIGANPILARVSSYYHDIGKSKKPQYFIENQPPNGENKHDKLSPSMSSLILISHVKEGVEMAKKYKLPSVITNFIPQHHGTSLIKYFYDKAKGKANPELQTVNEEDFRYHGPKPQTREAGIVMLADAVEAASMTLTDPTPARIQGMVQKIINNIFTDHQLDECMLTLKDLHQIAKSFNLVLGGIFHHRIDYSEPVTKEASSKRKSDADITRQSAKKDKDQSEEDKKDRREDLKRLGMS
ncbi:MAG: HDIG domain-containing protein [Deltaproteobacteria bacterium]|nr:MAG: HDIG domain-containing protein [Deltaproteobacteria bacterium]